MSKVNVGMRLLAACEHVFVRLQLKQLKCIRPDMETRSRWITVGIALCAAFAFALSVQSAWWTMSSVTVGPFGTRNCPGGADECGFTWLGTNHDLFMRAAVATRAGGYIAMFIYIMIAGAVAAKRTPALLSKSGIVAILTATVAAVTFFVKFPGAFAEPSLGAGPVLFAVGVISAAAASVRVLRAQR
jgi:hypothetical protein